VWPLVFASLQLQRDDTTLVDAVLSYLNIYIGFDKSVYRHRLVDDIEKRWSSVEQPLAMLAFVLHPKTALTKHAALCNIAVLYWHKLICDDPSAAR